MRRQRGKHIALFTMASSLAVIFAGALKWRELEKRYYLYRLKKNAAYVHNLIYENNDTLERETIREWVRTDIVDIDSLIEEKEKNGSRSPLTRRTAVALPGDIPVGEHLAFLAEYTGFPLIASPAVLLETVKICSKVEPVDAEAAFALLAAANVRISVEELSGNRAVLLATCGSGLSCPQSDKSIVRIPLPMIPSSRKIDIMGGDIQVTEFAKFLEKWTDIPVKVDKALQRRAIPVVAPLKNADAELIQVLMEVNGFAVKREDTPGGGASFRITASSEGDESEVGG